MKDRDMYLDEDVLQIQNEVRRYEEEQRNPTKYEKEDEADGASEASEAYESGHGEDDLSEKASIETETHESDMKQGEE